MQKFSSAWQSLSLLSSKHKTRDQIDIAFQIHTIKPRKKNSDSRLVSLYVCVCNFREQKNLKRKEFKRRKNSIYTIYLENLKPLHLPLWLLALASSSIYLLVKRGSITIEKSSLLLLDQICITFFIKLYHHENSPYVTIENS